MIRRNNVRAVAARAGFTLMEMLVVVAILVVLAGVGGYYYMKHLDEARVDAARLQCKVLTDACMAYKVKNGEFPPSLASLTQPGADGGTPYLEADALKTPWGGQYEYDQGGAHHGGLKPDVWATGPNGQQIGNW